MPRAAVSSSVYSVPVEGFTQATRAPAAGDLICVSGVTARDPEGAVVGEGDIRAQTHQVMRNLRGLMEDAGGTLDDVIRIVTYLRDMDDLMVVHQIRGEYFGESPPASTSVGVTRLFDPRQLIEIEAMAIVAAR
jgi:enamine deaminase RidA (YjgF/YER057c/UK114 family)